MQAPEPRTVRLLTETDLRQCVGLDPAALQAIDDAFAWLVERAVDMPPIQHLSVTDPSASANHLGDVDVKSAFVPGLDRLAVKIASGFYGNPAKGLPSGSGLMVVLDADTGFCRAVLLDNGYLTDLRTALAGGVAARYLAPENVETAGILGTGRQAELQARALQLVRPFRRLVIFGRTRAHAESLAERLRRYLPQVAVEIADSARSVVAEASCIVTTTASTQPLIEADWLAPGQHITAVGSDLPGKQELAPEVLTTADLYVCDRRSQCQRLGELQHLPESERSALESLELGEIAAGRRPGRSTEGQITVCDLTGTGVQDTAIAVHALDSAEHLGLGHEIAG